MNIINEMKKNKRKHFLECTCFDGENTREKTVRERVSENYCSSRVEGKTDHTHLEHYRGKGNYRLKTELESQ